MLPSVGVVPSSRRPHPVAAADRVPTGCLLIRVGRTATRSRSIPAPRATDNKSTDKSFGSKICPAVSSTSAFDSM